ncbi:MAG: hypothetical protein L0Y71_17765, partial [Gemmataceae bacterium]|nr:hypothetical protein [Gemmataceae bacterium]
MSGASGASSRQTATVARRKSARFPVGRWVVGDWADIARLRRWIRRALRREPTTRGRDYVFSEYLFGWEEAMIRTDRWKFIYSKG